MNSKLPLNRQTLDPLRVLESERPGLMKELIRLFVADAPKQMRLIDGAYAKRDPEGVRQAAHFLRSCVPAPSRSASPACRTGQAA